MAKRTCPPLPASDDQQTSGLLTHNAAYWASSAAFQLCSSSTRVPLFLIKREPGDRFARQIYVTVVQAEESVARVYPAEDQGLVRLAYVTTASQVIAEDVVQQVFTDIYQRFGELREPAAYSRRAVLSRCTSWVRRRIVERRHTGLAVAEEVVAALGADGTAVRAAMARLRPRQRAAVFLRYYLNLPESEITERSAAGRAPSSRCCIGHCWPADPSTRTPTPPS